MLAPQEYEVGCVTISQPAPSRDEWVACAVSAAHAVPNGLLLRADIRRLYDAGHVTVTPDHRFRVIVPCALTDQPDPELLDWHSADVFRG